MNIFEALLLFTIVKATNGQFLEQPDAMTVFVPVQDQVTLTCSVEEGYIIDWRIDLVNGAEAVYASDKIVREDLLQRGFTLEGVTSNESTLLLRKTEIQTNNGTNITCVARRTGVLADPVSGENSVTVIFYGAPPPPTDLSVTEDELGSVNISWSLGFIEGVPVNYTLTVLNLNTTSADSISEILTQYYIFSTDRPCDVYSFTVTAVTAAGNSTPSQEIIFASSESITASTRFRSTTSSYPIQSDTTTSFESLGGVMVYVGAATGVLVSIMLILIFISLCCCYRHRKNMNRSCTKDLESQLQVGFETTESGDQLYAHLNFESMPTEVEAEVEQHPLYAIVTKDKKVMMSECDKEKDVEVQYAHLDEMDSRIKNDKQDSFKNPLDPLYAIVDKSKKVPKVDEFNFETVKDKLYTHDARKSRRQVSMPQLVYFEVDESMTKMNALIVHSSEVKNEMDELYAQVDENKKERKALVADSSQSVVEFKTEVKSEIETVLYAQVDKKTSRHKGWKGVALAESSQQTEALYAEVDKSKKKIGNKSMTEAKVEVKAPVAIDNSGKKSIMAQGSEVASYAQINNTRRGTKVSNKELELCTQVSTLEKLAQHDQTAQLPQAVTTIHPSVMKAHTP